MSIAEIAARAKKKAGKTGGAKRKPASKCSSLVRKRDSLNDRIKAIEKANGDAMKKEQDKIEARHQAQHKKLDAEKAKALEKLASKYGQVCVAKPRKPRSDKGRTKAAAPATNGEAPKAASRPRAKKAAKRKAKAAAPAAEGPGVFGGELFRGQLLTTDKGVTVYILEDTTKPDGPRLVASTEKDTLTRGSFNLSGSEFGGLTMVFKYGVRTAKTREGFSSSARVTQDNEVIAEYPRSGRADDYSWLAGLGPFDALAQARPILFNAAAVYMRKRLASARKTQAAKEKRRQEQQELPCPGGC